MRNTRMFQVFDVTYRISRVRFGSYEIVRIRDEVLAGSFSHVQGRKLEVVPLAVDAVLMKRLVAEAVHAGKTAWMGVCAAMIKKEASAARQQNGK